MTDGRYDASARADVPTGDSDRHRRWRARRHVHRAQHSHRETARETRQIRAPFDGEKVAEDAGAGDDHGQIARRDVNAGETVFMCPVAPSQYATGGTTFPHFYKWTPLIRRTAKKKKLTKSTNCTCRVEESGEAQ